MAGWHGAGAGLGFSRISETDLPDLVPVTRGRIKNVAYELPALLISIIELEEYLEDLESDYHSQRKLIIRDKQTPTSYHFSKGMAIGAIDAIKKVQKWIKQKEKQARESTSA